MTWFWILKKHVCHSIVVFQNVAKRDRRKTLLVARNVAVKRI